MGEQLADEPLVFGVTVDAHEGVGFHQPAAQEEHQHGAHRADDEGNAPAPGFERGLGSSVCMEQDEQAQRQQLPADQRHILKTGEETPPPFDRRLRS